MAAPSNNASSSEQARFRSCYDNWITIQEHDLADLRKALVEDRENEERLTHLAQRTIRHFQEYSQNRALLAHENSPALCCPASGSSFAKGFAWLGGCKPSAAFTLFRSLGALRLDSHLRQVQMQLEPRREGGLADLSELQFDSVGRLHIKVRGEEAKIMMLMSNSQEALANTEIILKAYKEDPGNEENEENGVDDPDVHHMLDERALSLASITKKADKLRMKTLKELVSILTPLQAVDYLAGVVSLHYKVPEWGNERDRKHGWLKTI